MTGWRGSIGWKLEDTFGVESGVQGSGFGYFAPGLTFTYTPNNQIKYTYTTGSKFYDVATAGRFKGDWSGTILLDYNHFRWLLTVFEDYHYDITENKHVFTKSNRKFMRSFSIKVTKLNRIVGGNYDQQTVLLGCVVTSFRPNFESSSGATVSCSISGLYVDEYQVLDDLEETEFEAMEPDTPAKYPVEWGCLQVPDGTPLANNEKTGITINSSITTLPSCGTRFDSAFYEGSAGTISLTSKVYSRKPDNWYLRLYSGGEYQDPASPNGGIPGQSATAFAPFKKNLRPLATASINSSGDSGYSSKFLMKNVMVESMAQNYNQSNEIVDEPTLKAKTATLFMQTPLITSNLLSANYTGGSVGVCGVLQDYTITYDLDGGSASPVLSSFTGCNGDTFQTPSSGVTKSGYTLTGWSDGITTYSAGDVATINERAVAESTTTITFTAQWTASQ